MACSAPAGPGQKVVDVATQIITPPDAVADASGPGGLRHAVVLTPGALEATQSFNLASTRVVRTLHPGMKSYYFNVTNLRMDSDTVCFVYNAPSGGAALNSPLRKSAISLAAPARC